jgi:hypothetical protein
MPESLLARLTADTLRAALALRDAELSALPDDTQKLLRAQCSRGAHVVLEVGKNSLGDPTYALALIARDGQRKPITAATRAWS